MDTQTAAGSLWMRYTRVYRWKRDVRPNKIIADDLNTLDGQWTNRQLDWATNMMMIADPLCFAMASYNCGRITALENLGLFVVRHYLTSCLQISSQTHAHMRSQRTFPTVTRMNPTLPIFSSMEKWRRLHIQSWMRITWNGDNEMWWMLSRNGLANPALKYSKCTI